MQSVWGRLEMSSSVKVKNKVKKKSGGRKPGVPSERTSIYMEKILRDRLKSLKAEKNINFNTVVNQALKDYLDKPKLEQLDFDFAKSIMDSLPEGAQLVDKKFLNACAESFFRNLTDLSRLKVGMESKTLAPIYDRPEIHAYLKDGLEEVVRLGREMFYLTEEQTRAMFEQIFEEQRDGFNIMREANSDDPLPEESPTISDLIPASEELPDSDIGNPSWLSKLLPWRSR